MNKQPTRNQLKQTLSQSEQVTVQVHGLQLTAHALAPSGPALQCTDAQGNQYTVTLWDQHFARVTKQGRKTAIARDTRYTIQTS